MIFTKKKLFIFALIAVALGFVIFRYTKIGPAIREFVISIIPKWRLEECVKNFDIKKFNFDSPKKWSDDESRYLMFNSAVMEDFLNKNAEACIIFKSIETNDIQFSFDACRSQAQVVETITELAETLKRGTTKDIFMENCQNSLIQLDDFKENVEENKRQDISKVACESIFFSFEKGEIVLEDSLFSDSNLSFSPVCECMDADGNKKNCKSGLCSVMGFFAAVSKNNQSLCPKITDVKILPYCNQYFDKQTAEKYKRMFKENYCSNQ